MLYLILNIWKSWIEILVWMHFHRFSTPASRLVSLSDQFHHLTTGILFSDQLEICKKVCWKILGNLGNSPKIFNWSWNFRIEISVSFKPGKEIERKWAALILFSSSPHFSRLPKGKWDLKNLASRNTFESCVVGKSFWFVVWLLLRTIMFRVSMIIEA